MRVHISCAWKALSRQHHSIAIATPLSTFAVPILLVNRVDSFINTGLLVVRHESLLHYGFDRPDNSGLWPHAPRPRVRLSHTWILESLLSLTTRHTAITRYRNIRVEPPGHSLPRPPLRHTARHPMPTPYPSTSSWRPLPPRSSSALAS